MNYKSYKSYDSHVKQTHTKHKYLKTKCINTALKYKCKKKSCFFFLPLPLSFSKSLGASLQSCSGQQQNKQVLRGSKTTRQAYRSLGIQYLTHLRERKQSRTK